MYIEITLPTGSRAFVRKDSIATVVVGKTLKEENPVVTTTNGVSYTVTVDAEKNALARLIGMRS
jgi:hypothetical protein